mmetsp:Transcript_44316/g.87235  ORF Transcript_44316/g.87235 Transcript_44316/m.87235 type:complete len:344 (+) Transcript_44316:82-1113(+)
MGVAAWYLALWWWCGVQSSLALVSNSGGQTSHPALSSSPASLALRSSPALVSAFPKYRGLVTFDLDDCVWPIIPVVSHANEAVEIAYNLDRNDVQRTMKEIRVSSQQRGDSPFSYKKARIQTYELLLHSKKHARDCFELWLSARNKAGGDLLFPDVVPCLEQLVQSGWLVGAITNGLGDPSSIPSLEPHFQFCVSGEDEDVFPHRKPARQIFEAASLRARTFGFDADAALALAQMQSGPPTLPPSLLSPGASPLAWWHVGDDLANDVAGAQALGIKTLLLQRPSLSQQSAQATNRGMNLLPSAIQNPFSTASPEEMKARDLAAENAKPDLVLSNLLRFCDLVS